MLTGAKSWPDDFLDGPRQQTLTQGKYPEIPLKRARALVRGTPATGGGHQSRG